MRCLMCGRNAESSGRITDILFRDDPLCPACRGEWKRYGRKLRIGDIEAEAVWEYEGGFRRALLQYKECGDEALADVFLYPVKEKIRRKYWNCAFLLMPSRKSNLERRGFDHLRGMFSGCGNELLSVFEIDGEWDQKGKGAAERAEMEGRIRLKEGVVLPEKLVLADDVITTGSTLRGALKCLPRQGHRIRILSASAVKYVP